MNFNAGVHDQPQITRIKARCLLINCPGMIVVDLMRLVTGIQLQ